MNKTDKIVKIKYAYHQMSIYETFGIVGIVAGIALLIIGIVTFQRATLDNSATTIMMGILIGFISLGVFLAERGKRKDKIYEHDSAVINGKKVIGTIINVSVVDLRGRNPGDMNFSYDVEYESPDNGGLIAIKTPAALQENMYIKDEDLPLKAVVYIHKGEAFVDAVINPPLAKMHRRQFVKMIPTFIVIALVITSLILAALNLSIAAFVCFIIAGLIGGAIVYLGQPKESR